MVRFHIDIVLNFQFLKRVLRIFIVGMNRQGNPLFLIYSLIPDSRLWTSLRSKIVRSTSELYIIIELNEIYESWNGF